MGWLRIENLEVPAGATWNLSPTIQVWSTPLALPRAGSGAARLGLEPSPRAHAMAAFPKSADCKGRQPRQRVPFSSCFFCSEDKGARCEGALVRLMHVRASGLVLTMEMVWTMEMVLTMETVPETRQLDMEM